MWQGASGYSPYEGIVSPAYTVLSPNSGINSKCLAYQFKLPEMIHTFQINSQDKKYPMKQINTSHGIFLIRYNPTEIRLFPTFSFYFYTMAYRRQNECKFIISIRNLVFGPGNTSPAILAT